MATLYLGGIIDWLTDIWHGYMAFGLSGGWQIGLLVLDFLLVVIASYYLLILFNTKEGISYLLFIFLAIVLLAITAYFSLSGLHLFCQLALGGLVIGLPFSLRESWSALQRHRAIANQLPERKESYLGKFGAIVLSIVIGLVFVLINNGLPVRVGQYPEEIPLTAVNLGTGMSANFGDNQTVRVVISAPLSAWRSLSRENFSAVVDGSKRTEGTYDLNIVASSRSSEIKIVRIKPERVVVSVEPIIVKTVPVSARYTGRAGNDLVPDEAIFDPEKVEISGARSVVDSITQALVEIKLNGETETIETKSAPVFRSVNDSLIGSISSNPKEVSVKVPLVKAGRLKTVGIKAVITGQPTTGYWVKTTTITPPVIAITGRADLLEQAESISTSNVSVEGISAAATFEVTLNFPDGISAAEDIGKATVRVELASTSTSKTITPEIQYEGLASSLKVTSLTPASVSVIVSGDASVLASVDSTVKITLNLSSYKSAGNYALSLTSADFSLPSGISLVSFLPSSIDAKLENK